MWCQLMSSTAAAAAATAATASVGETCVVVVFDANHDDGTLDDADVVAAVGGGTAVDQTTFDQIGFLNKQKQNKMRI